jgi:hypothetical protein
MELTVTISFVQEFPKRYEWSAARPDGSLYARSSGPPFGSSAQAMDSADESFKNLAIMWDWGAHLPEELGKPVYRGHVFVAEESATRS